MTLIRPLPACAVHRQYVVRWFFRVCAVALALAAAAERTLQWATAVAVFFLPKHCTDWEAILSDWWLVRARSWEVRAVDLTFKRLRDRGQERKLASRKSCGC